MQQCKFRKFVTFKHAPLAVQNRLPKKSHTAWPTYEALMLTPGFQGIQDRMLSETKTVNTEKGRSGAIQI